MEKDINSKKHKQEFKLKKYSVQLRLFLLLVVDIAIIAVLIYFFIPIILNYPAGTYGTDFQTELEGTNYFMQIFSTALAILIALVLIIFFKTRFITKNFDLIQNPPNYTEKQINKVKSKLFQAPYSIYLLSIVIPCAITFISRSHLMETTLKLVLLLFCLLTIFLTTIFLYSAKLFKQILLHLPLTDTSNIKHIPIQTRFFYNIFPLLFVSLLFLALFGYSQVVSRTGNSEFEAYHNDILYICDSHSISSLKELLSELNSSISFSNDSDYIFIRLPDGSFIDSSFKQIEFSDFFVKYLNEFSASNKGRVYEYYGLNYQAATANLDINGETYTVGIYFKILSNDVFCYFILAFIILFLINYIFINFFSSSLTFDINNLATNFDAMSNEHDLKFVKKITPITNDEIADLCIAYNSIQELTFNNFKTIQNNQDMLIEQERLASLGQMIGGIAHNLKTPIFSVAGGLEGLSDLINEYDASIDNPSVTGEDMHEIAGDMREWIEKLKGHISYMSDVITTVKGQTVTLADNESIEFSVTELFKRVDILMKHEIKNALATLKIQNNVGDFDLLTGNINSLVQIINNIISNSIEAYGNNYTDKIIELTANRDNSNLIISIKDYGPGISEIAQAKLFKEMITTKGKNGTGLGMFMSYSNIRAHFNGNLSYETETRKRYYFLYYLTNQTLTFQ